MPEYFISPTGNNNNPGTIEAPFKTIQKCANIAQAGDSCSIREGIYRETVTPANSGQAGRPIIFQSYNGESVVISGADIIQGEWQLHENNIYKITLDPSFDLGIGNNQIFIDRYMAIEARWPNIDDPIGLTRDNHAISSNGELFLKRDRAENNNYQASAYYQSPELEQFPQGFWDDAYISFVPGYEWWGNVGSMIESSPGRVDFEFDFPTDWLKYHHPSGDDPFYLWGIYQALDTENEWFFDAAGSEGTPFALYLMPPGGTLQGKTVEIKVRDRLFEINNQSYIELNNLEFFAGRIVIDGTSHHIVVNQIVMQYAADGKGLSSWVNPAIRVHGDANQVLNSTIRDTASSAIVVKGQDHVIQNNIITNTGYTSAVSDGIQIVESSNAQVRNNTIFNTSSLGISSIGKTAKITHNHIWNIGLQETDTAAINSWNAGDTEGTEIAYNLVHDVIAYGGTPTHYAGKGIRLDAGGSALGNSHYYIHDNIVYKTTADSIVIWGLQDNQPNYGNAQNYVENNTVESIRLTDKDNHAIAGTTVKRNIANQYRFGSDPKETDAAIVEHNLFYLTQLPNNLQPGQLFSRNPSIEPVLTAYFPVLDSGTIQLPYRRSVFQHEGQDIGARPFIPGAVIIDKDLLKLSAQVTAQNSDTIAISGLPMGRKIPETFQLKLENGQMSSDCYNITEIGTIHTKAYCKINPEELAGDRTVYVSLTGDNFQPISLSIDTTQTSPVTSPQTSSDLSMIVSSAIAMFMLGLAWTFKSKLF